MKWNKQQKKALNDFNSFGYVVIEAPRRSGKTTFLRYLAETHELVYVCVPNYAMFRYLYNDIAHVRYHRPGTPDPKEGLLIGDEVFIAPIKGVKTACAITAPYIINHWKTDIDKKVLKDMKAEMTDEKFRSEFML